MIAYLELIDNIKTILLAQEDINTVTIGDPDQIDIKKQSLFPMGHLMVGAANFINGMVSFSVTIYVMDLVDITKDNPVKGEEEFQTNKIYVQNTMLSVIEILNKNLLNGALQEAGWEIIGSPSAEPFEDRFESLLTGWAWTVTVSIPNTVQNCA